MFRNHRYKSFLWHARQEGLKTLAAEGEVVNIDQFIEDDATDLLYNVKVVGKFDRLTMKFVEDAIRN